MAQTEARPNMRKRWQDLFSGMKKKETQVQLEQEAVEAGDGEAPVSKQIKAVQEKLAGAGEPTDATEQALGKPTEATKEDEVEMDQEPPVAEAAEQKEEAEAASQEQPQPVEEEVHVEEAKAAEEPTADEAVVEEVQAAEQPQAAEEQAPSDEPEGAEEPAVAEAVVQEASQEQPQAVEEQALLEEEEPTADEAVVEEVQAAEQPQAAEEQAPSDEPEGAEEPAVAEAAAQEASQEQPRAAEERALLEEEEAPAVVPAETREVAAKFEALEVEYAQLSEQLETTESDKWEPMVQVQRNTLRKVMTVVADLQTELAETKACNEALEEDLQVAERICTAFVERRQKDRGEALAGCEAMPAGQEAKP